MGANSRVHCRNAESVIWLSQQTAYEETISGQTQSICPQVFKKLEPLCGKEEWILEIGAGPGVMLDVFQTNGYVNLAATELTKEGVDALHKKKFYAIQNDIHELYIVYNEYGVRPRLIIGRHVLEHSPFPMLVLLQISDILRVDGGFLYVEVPAPDTPMLHEFNENHYSVMGKRAWEGLFARCGFQRQQGFDIKFSVEQPGGGLLDDTYYSWILEVPKS